MARRGTSAGVRRRDERAASASGLVSEVAGMSRARAPARVRGGLHGVRAGRHLRTADSRDSAALSRETCGASGVDAGFGAGLDDGAR
ncbi:hypothetical protein WS91_10300 [Burkholderia sp. MSMB1498]|nr:hypothetical protein WS91_10300 [Burkholderia sp. MSMB1498]